MTTIDENPVLVTPKRGRPPKNPVQEMLATVKSIDDTSLVEPDPNTPKVPQQSDPEWTDYVLSHLTSSEKDEKNGYPKTFGLKRLVLKLIGNIKDSYSHLDASPDVNNNFNASVSHHLVVEGYDDRVYNITGLGGSNINNTDPEYRQYPEAIASSRAYSRALKDVLNINCTAADEVSEVAKEDNDDDTNVISSTQKSGIKNMCKRLGIDVLKFINLGEKIYTGLDDENLKKAAAKGMVSQLNKYQGGLEIPENIKL